MRKVLQGLLSRVLGVHFHQGGRLLDGRALAESRAPRAQCSGHVQRGAHVRNRARAGAQRRFAAQAGALLRGLDRPVPRGWIH